MADVAVRPVPPVAAASGPGASDPIRARLDDLLTRAFYSGSGYVFESEPYVVADDAELLEAFAKVREDDRRHAHVLGALIQGRGGVPAPGVFPWWDLDLNYLSVPCLSRFVVEGLEEEIPLYAGLVAAWPHDDPGGLAALESMYADRRAHLARLRILSTAALEREAEAVRAAAAAVTSKRNARLAKEKAAAEAARKARLAASKPGGAPAAVVAKAAAPSAASLDPNEPNISPKERARRQVARIRAKQGGGAAAASSASAGAAAPTAAAPVASGAALLDPNEPGISPKEKAKRVVAMTRAKQGGGAAAAAPGPAASAPAASSPTAAVADLGDPDEPGIPPKEKAKRQMARLRAQRGAAPPSAGSPPAAANATSAPAAAPPAPVAEATPLAEDLGDPDEPGLSPKEKARRQIARIRAQKAAGG